LTFLFLQASPFRAGEEVSPLQYYALLRNILEESSSDVLFIDSISAMRNHMDEADFIKTLRYLQLLAKEKKITFIMNYLPSSQGIIFSTGFSTLMDSITILSYEIPASRVRK